jgi:DNA-binding MarR family transcriptional regulator
MDNNSFIVKQNTEDRLYVPVYQDFLDSLVLTGKEKLIYILLKRYLKFRENAGEVYPTIDTLCKQSNMSKPTVIKIIKQLEKKNLLKIEQRGLNKPNLYTLNDNSNMWRANSIEEVKEAIDEQEEQKYIELLKSKGYEVIKKELKSETDQSTDLNPKINQHYNLNNTTKIGESQYTKAFSRDMVNEIYDFNIILHDRSTQKEDFDSLFELILEILNSTLQTIRINGEDIPIEIVKSRFLKLNYMHLEYVIDEVEKQSNIKNKRSYLITSLYNSYTTINLHYSNIVNNDNK